MIFYIIYAVSTKESLEDKKLRTRKESLQKEKIGKLFQEKINLIVLLLRRNLFILSIIKLQDLKT